MTETINSDGKLIVTKEVEEEVCKEDLESSLTIMEARVTEIKRQLALFKE